MLALAPLRRPWIAFALALALSAFANSLSAQEPVAKKPLDPEHAAKFAAGLKLFREQVRDVLVSRCLDCHTGADAESQFDITTRKSLLKGGVHGPAIVTGDATKSKLMRLVRHELAPEMPLEGQQLTASEIAALAKWIDLGAPYDKPLKTDGEPGRPWTETVVEPAARNYWAFQPLARVSPPAVRDAAWCRGEIDRFVLAKQEAAGLTPNGPADRRTLIRRAYFDLIGLPPTPAEVDAFVNDPDDNAFEKVVDHLLASKHYGERWGRHWLDLARFAESHGFEQDYDRPHAYHYRDFVIRALNDDMPYDQFVAWQLAGDELAPDNPLAMMATGFLGAGVFPTQLTEREFESARYDELDDMVGTLGTAMLGMTIGCARCHDHKFDPIPQADYARMVAVFATTIRSEITLDLSTPAERAAARQQQRAKLQAARAALETFDREQLPAAFEKFVAAAKPGGLKASPWTILDVAAHQTAAGTTLKKQADGSLRKVGETPAKDVYTLVARTSQPGITAVRLEAFADPAFPRGGPGLAPNGNFCLSDFRVAARPAGSEAPAVEVRLTAARATFQQNQGGLSAQASLDDDPAGSGWAVDQGGIGKDQAVVFVLAEPLAIEGEVELTFTLRFDHPNTRHAIGRPRLAVTSGEAATVAIRDGEDAVPHEVAQSVARLAAGETVTEAQRQTALAWYAQTLPARQKLTAALEAAQAAPAAAQPVKVMVCSEGLPKLPHHADGRGFKHFYPVTHYLRRGDVNAKQGEAQAAYLQVLMRGEQPGADPRELAASWKTAPPPDARTSYRRASLANWITDTQRGAGGLLARVIVNRLWQHHFGRGIVGTPSDFGTQGEAPTHPELLEYLAGELLAGGWRLKRLHKQMMLSSTYRQAGDGDQDDARIDPENRLLWRREPQRLEGEIIRDAILAVTGQLDTTPFGPGTLDQGMRRRSIYFTIKRSKLIPMMQIFDQPEPLVSQGSRPATTIAPQALLFMNNPEVRAWSQSFARRLAPAAERSLAEAVDLAYQTALARHASERERKQNAAFLTAQIASYEAEQQPHPRELALADFCQVLISLNEFVFVE